MKNLFLIIAFCFLPLLMKGQSDYQVSSVIMLKPRDFSEEMDRVIHVLVDVREPFEYRRSRIPGAINIPSQADLLAFADTTYIATHIFVYCTTDPRSTKVTEILSDKGFIHLYNLDGGIAGWKKAGLPVEKRKKKP